MARITKAMSPSSTCEKATVSFCFRTTLTQKSKNKNLVAETEEAAPHLVRL
jgi:hypothetical protein